MARSRRRAAAVATAAQHNGRVRSPGARAGDGERRAMKRGEEIALRLRDEIIAGRLEPNAPLRLAALAERLGVSTTPVREALTILERQGLLYYELHRGFRVAEITAKDIADIYTVHALVSQLLTERATRRLSDEDIDELDELDAAMHEADGKGDVAAAADCNHELHRRINLKAGSPLLARFLGETTPFVVRRQDPAVPGWKEQRVAGHGDLLAAIRRRDGVKAGELMAAHIRRSGELASEFAEQAAVERAAGKGGSRRRPARAAG